MNSAPRGTCESLEHVLGILLQAGTTKEYPPGVWVIKVGIFRMPASSKMLRQDLDETRRSVGGSAKALRLNRA